VNWLKLFSNRPWLHLVFWSAWIALWANALSTELPMWKAAFSAALLAATYAVFVYANLRLAIPRLLWAGRYGAYAIALVVLALLCGLALYELSLLIPAISGSEEQESAWLRLLSSVLSAVLMLFITTSFKLVLHSLEQQQQHRQLENQKLQTELDFLKSQVNPHFLFNTLNNLYALTLSASERAPEVVLKLSAILRYMLYECNEPQVFLNKEIAYLQNYIELEELRQDGTNSIQLLVSGNTDRKMIAPLLFTPLLENAIKHGLNRSTESAWVRMELKVEGMELSFAISNSKSPRQAASAGLGARSGGIGLINVKRRLDLIYPHRHQFRISENAETYSVTLQLTLSE
jgi:sensor histidine kinase YesM